MKHISEETRNNIISLLDTGLSSRPIALQLGVSHTTVDRVRAKFRPEMQKNQGGRPAKLTVTDKRRLVRMVTSGEADTAVQLTQEFKNTKNIELSVQTVRRTLKEAGLKAITKKKKPRLLPRHIRQRLDFALKYQHWTVKDWKRVIWSDETKIKRLGSDGRKWVWKRPGGMLTEQHVKGTVKYGGGSLMIWGCMTAQGVGYACRIDGHMDAELYTHILSGEFLQSLEYYELEVDEIIFQQDNDPKHTSRIAQRWFEGNGVEVLNWPAQSPDLNPIEHLWQHLKQQLSAYKTEPGSMYELWERVETEWNKIPTQLCIDLITSMPRRVAAVLKAKGGYIKY
jgi:transposase